MSEEAVEPQEPIEEIIDQAMPEQESSEEAVQETERPSKTMVPLTALQKEREKKREIELELQWERQERQRLLQERNAAPKPPEEEDNARFESATKEDLRSAQEETYRAIEERLWIKQNPDLYAEVNELLPKFLKQRPNLASAINQASNRYEEAYTLMKALSPKQQKEMRTTPQQKKEAPNAPTSVPKAAAMNEAVDLMNMSDSEFAAWRASKRGRR